MNEEDKAIFFERPGVVEIARDSNLSEEKRRRAMENEKKSPKERLLDAVKTIQEVSKETGVPFSEQTVGSIAQTILNNEGKDERTEKIGSQKNSSQLAGKSSRADEHSRKNAKGVAVQNENAPATDAQIKLLYKLSAKLGKSPREYLEKELFGKKLSSVTRKEASDGIETVNHLLPENGNGSAKPSGEDHPSSVFKEKAVSQANGDRPATEKQIDLLFKLAEDVDPANPENYIQYAFGKAPYEMTMKEASQAISKLIEQNRQSETVTTEI